jgi:hypothetical protein
MKKYTSLKELYNNIREDLKDISLNDTASIIQELIYTIDKGIHEADTIDQINDILGTDDTDDTLE